LFLFKKKAKFNNASVVQILCSAVTKDVCFTLKELHIETKAEAPKAAIRL